jgi:hypothetical protein
MAVKHVDFDDTYKIRTTTQNIVVDVVIGDGQVGSYSVFLGRKLVKSNAPADLGKKSEVLGKRTIISVTVVDTLKQTNWTSMTVFINEGASETIYGPYKVMAENHLDTIIYTLKLINE